MKLFSSKAVMQWYVAYVFPKSEKKVQSRLDKMGIESYLPMHQVIKNRRDRNKLSIAPLFPNYIFVYTTELLRHESFCIKEIVRYVAFAGKAATVNAAIINNLKCILKKTLDLQIERSNITGTKVTITNGPFIGTEGKVVTCYGKTKLIIQIEALKIAVGVIISADDIIPYNCSDIYVHNGS